MVPLKYKGDIVVPGEEIGEDEHRGGFGTFERDGHLISSNFGFVKVNERAGYVNVVPIKGRYYPRVNDKVIGRIRDLGPTNWTVDIGAPYPAPLHAKQTEWDIKFGDTAQFLSMGDVILAQIINIDEMQRIHLTLRNPGLKKLRGGRILAIPHTKVPRIIGRGGSMINMLKEGTDTRIFVGQNGIIWIDGDVHDIKIVVECVEFLVSQSSKTDLEDGVDEILSRRELR